MGRPPGHTIGERATRGDVDALYTMRRAAEDWLAARGIGQWCRGEVSRHDIAGQVEHDEWFVTRLAGTAVAGLRYLDRDEDVWPDDEPGQARYVHGLVTDRRLAPSGSGARLLRWAEDRARSEGITLLRLDCVESNARLRRLYGRLGYREVGRRDFAGPWFSATLLEKDLS